MKKIMSLLNRVFIKFKKIFNTPKKVIFLVVLLLIGGFVGSKVLGQSSAKPQYQTSQVEKGTLITSVSASGTISSGSSANITTNATGIVSKVYVKNGDTITQGQTIAEITLDQNSQQKQASAYASYLQAQNQLESAKAKINSLQSAAFAANQKFINDAVARDLETNDPTYIQENANWLQAEADYNNQALAISGAQASLNSAALSLQQISSVITAPTSGVISNLTLAPGVAITSQSSSSSSSSNSTSTQTLGTITIPQGTIQAKVNLSEIDAAKVKAGQKATLELDAFPDKTFTGKVLLIDTNGQTSSGVTTYPATIALDSATDSIYPNMAVTAKIITDVKNDVLLVPSSAIQTSNNQSTARVLKNGQLTPVNIEIGGSNDTQTEITSGLSEGDNVVTSILTQTTGSQNTGTSPFSGIGGGNRNGGGNVRIMTR
jgi:membrane fusion protein, macrolide-specific efflux system